MKPEKTKFQTILEILLDRIRSGYYKDLHLPPEICLAEEFSANRHTVRKVLAHLQENNYLTRTPGRGSFINPNADSPVCESVEIILRVPFAGNVSRRSFDDSENFYNSLLRRFSEKYPNIRISMEQISVSCSKSKVIASNLDILYPDKRPAMLIVPYLAEDAACGRLQSLDSLDSLIDIAACLDPRLFRRYAGPDGKRHFFSVPISMVIWSMGINMPLFRKLGYSESDFPCCYDEMLDLCRDISLKDRKAPLVSMEFLEYPASMTRYMPFIAPGDSCCGCDNGEFTGIDEDSTRDFINFMKELYPFNSLSITNGQPLFQLSMTGSQFMNEDYMPLPLLRSKNMKTPFSVINGQFLTFTEGFFKKKPYIQAAKYFIEFMLSKEIQLEILKDKLFFPARAGIFREIEKMSPQIAAIYETGHKYGFPTFDIPAGNDIHYVLRQMLIQGITGICSPEIAVAKAQILLAQISKGIPLDEELASRQYNRSYP